MGELLSGWKRTCMCAELDKNNISQEVTLMGWVNKRRDLGNLIFVDLRDRTGLIQIVFDVSKCGESFKYAETLRSEYVISVKGIVIRRSEETINPNMATGEIEVAVSELKILSTAQTPPISVCEDQNVSEILRLKYRYLDLRRPEMQQNLILKHKIMQCARKYFNDKGFLEIETPMLTKSTPEGARDYLVPSRVHPGEFYALPQSPQLFKQLLMVSGFDKYYQIARCFRDEDLRADRQPEFTQIDTEMSFVDVDDVIEMHEGLISAVFKEALNMDIELPLRRITYKEAMERYGSDKPDTRFELELQNISDLVKDSEFKVFSNAVKNGGSVRGINGKGCVPILSRRDLDGLVDYVKTFNAKGMAWVCVTDEGIKSPIAKFFTEQQMSDIVKRMNGEKGDILFFVADKNTVVFNSLGQLRLKLAKILNVIDKSKFNLLWVTEFPLLEYSEEEKRLVAVHHPFTSPMDEDLDLLDAHPEKVRAKAYDIVLNGVELGGGSIRIHDEKLQEKMFSIIGLSKEKAMSRFGFLLEAFKYGTPPHGGLAYGLDRMIMLLAGRDTIRDVIAFPKVQNASCPLTDAPSCVDADQLRDLHIRID